MNISTFYWRLAPLVLLTLFASFSQVALAAPTGEFRYPNNNHTFDGNLLFSGRVSDPDGIGNLRLRFNGDSNQQINLCNNCGTNKSFTDAGINPRDFNLNIGSHQAQLIVVKNGNEQTLDSLRFNWQPPEISGITVSRSFGEITISWSGLSGYSLYNLYIASEAGISPNTIDNLPDSITFRSLRSTSQTISGIDDELGLFGLVTGTDTSGESAYSQVFRIEALDNQDPQVTSESVTLAEDSSVNGNVLSNDVDPEGQPLTATLVFATQDGEVSLDGNGDFSYQPDSNFNGSDSFTYQVDDPQGGSQIGTVTFTVTAVNDAPQTSPDNYQLAEDTVLSISATDGVLENDSDIDGDELTVALDEDPQNGSLQLNDDGSFTYQPVNNFFGTDSFRYFAEDGNGERTSETVTLLITPINDTPVAQDDIYEMQEDTTLAISNTAQGLLANDSDPDLSAAERFTQLTVTLITDTSNGELTLQSDGTFAFTPEPDFFGSVGFSYQISDEEGATATANVNIEVVDLPESPIAQDDSYQVNEDTLLNVSAVDGILNNDLNVNDGQMSLTLLSNPQSGVLNLNNDGSFSYQPNENFNGSDNFSYQVSNSLGSSEANVVIQVISVNDLPVVTDDQVETVENTTLIISPLNNDSDPDGDTLTLSITSVSSGTAAIQGSDIEYTPETDFTGEATINYLANDQQGGETAGLITINVLAQNEPPVAIDDTVTTDEDTPITITPLSNDNDPDGDSLSLSILTVSSGSAIVNNNETIEFTPEADFNGSASITYQITDPAGTSDGGLITITVNPVNDAPVIEDDEVTAAESETITIAPLENDTDVDGDTLSITAAQALNGTVSFSSETISYTAPDTPGTDSISYTITDPSGATATGNIAVTISNVQDAPIAQDDTATTDEDSAVVISPLDNDTDEDGDTLSVSIDSVTNGEAELASSTTIRYTPTANFFGTATIEYTASDEAGNTDSATITITVSSVNDAPDARRDSASTNEDTSVTIDVLANDTDEENDDLTLEITSVNNGVATVNNNETITFTPDDNFNGETSLDYTIYDTSNASDTTTIDITVLAINDAPVAEDDTATIDQGESISISPLENDSDVEGDNLTLTAATAETGTVSVNTDATTLTYTAPDSFSGSDTITYTVTDTKASTTGSITVTVNDVNIAPVATNDSFDVYAGESSDLDVLANDSDSDGDDLTITDATATSGTVSISSDASTLSYTAPSDTTGTDTVSYTISDPSGATASATATITITEQSLDGDFDSDGDGNSDVSATSDGSDYTVTFGDDVDAVYYQEDGSYVSISANDDGSYELTIEGTSTSGKLGKKYAGIKSSENNDFVLPSTTNTVYYTIDGVEYSFTVSNLNSGSPNVAFGPPSQLDTNFEGATSHDFYLRQATFSGPLRFGVENGEHYILSEGGTGMVRGSDFDSDLTWQETGGVLEIIFDNDEEFEQQVNVYDLDDDNSDGIALNVITKAEADAYVAAYNDEFVTAYLSEAQQNVRFLRDNRIFIDAEIDLYYQYRIDSSLYPEITSADSGVVASQVSEILPRQLWNIDALKLQKLSYSDIAQGIATEVPWVSNGIFEKFAADFCNFSETSPSVGTGYCGYSDQSFSWEINNNVLNLDFGNEISAAYRWLDDLIVENTFSIELAVGSGIDQAHYSKHVYWLEIADVTDSAISELLNNHYFDSAYSKSNPDGRDSDKSIKTSELFGFYFESSGLAKNLTSREEFDGTSLVDTDRRWETNSGLISIFSQSTASSGNTFSYEYDQCTDNADSSCFIWKVRVWQPIIISNNRMWVWETVLINDTGPYLDTMVNFEELISPRLQYYELNNSVPGAPNSISFNQEPIWGNIDFNTDINVSINNLNLLNNFADPEADALSILNGAVEHGVLTINNDSTINYTPETDFIGDTKYSLQVSDGINNIYAFGTISVLEENIAPVANDDSFTAFSGIQKALLPLDNDTDENDDFLTITSATTEDGVVAIDDSNTELDFTADASFTGTATITYSISDGRGGSDTAQISVTVAQPIFSGSYDFDDSTVDDFTISPSGGDFSVVFGEEVSAVYYQENGEIYVVSRNADGLFEFVYNGDDSNIAELSYVINGVTYSFAPDDLSLTTPNLVYYGENEIINDFAEKSDYLLISRHPAYNSALATAFENGTLYDLQNTGFGSFSSPSNSDSVSWDMDFEGILSVYFDNPITETIYYNVYDLDDENNNDGALGVITKAEADAYYAAYEDYYVPVNISTIAHELDAYNLQGYFYEVNINYIQAFQIDSSIYPEITSADSGVLVESGGDYKEFLDTEKFNFLPITSDTIVGTSYLPVVIEDGAGNFMQFASDECTLVENSAGSNNGTLSCLITGNSATWSIETDGSVAVDFGNSVSAVYRWLDHSDIENTLFVKALDINGFVYSTLDYWMQSSPPSASDVNALINGNYLEISDNITNEFNYQDGVLNDSIGNGYYFDNSGLAKALSTYYDDNNDIAVTGYDLQWQIDGSAVVALNALSNLSSSDAYTYRYSQCTDSADQECYIWQTRTWIPVKIQDDRLWVLDYEERDPDYGYYSSGDTLEIVEYPKLRFYAPYDTIPGEPDSISFNQEPVFASPGYIAIENTDNTLLIGGDISDPEGDSLSIVEAEVDSGSIVINNDNTATFTPDTGFLGTVNLKFTVDDGINQVTFYDTIDVISTSDFPVANDDFENAVGGHSYIFDVLSNDTDPNGDTLTIISLDTSASGFSLTSGGAAIAYDAPASTTATLTVSYTVDDGNDGDSSATLTINLVPNSAPVATDDNLANVTVGLATTLSPLDNDTDADGDELSIDSASSSNGSVTISGDALSLDFTPSSAGTATINYTVSDGYGGSDTGVITVTAVIGNSSPVAIDDNYVVNPSTTESLTPLDNDSDSDSDSLTITSASASVGSVNITNSGTTLDYTAPSSGTDTISYSISDGNGGVDSATVNITINTAPDALDDTASGLEDQTHVVSPLSNDTDSDGDNFIISSVSASSGTAVKLSDTQLTYANSAPGTYSINYQITDDYGLTDTATITFTVTNRPAPVDDTETVNESETVSLSPLDNDTDVESSNSALIISSISGYSGSASINSGDRTITYTAPTQASVSGTQDFITYTVEDEDGGTFSALITININAVPIAQDDTKSIEQGNTVTISPLDNDTDADSDTLTIDSASASSGSVSITGSGATLSYTAPAGLATTDTISYSISDGNGGSDSGSITITVTNNTPVAAADSYILVSANGLSASIDSSVGVLANDSDPNSDSLTVSIVTNPSNDNAFALNSDGSFSYEHDGSTTLTDSFTYQVSDGTYSSQATATLTIKRANFTPGICSTPKAFTQAGENYSQTIQIMDLDEDTQTFSISGQPSWLTLNTVDGSTATLTGSPGTSDLGTSSITFTTTDGFDSESLTFDLTVIDEFATSSNTDIEFGGTTEVVNDAIIDNYGNIVVVGTSDGDFAVTRLLRDGSTDTSFNSGSVYTYNFGGSDDVAISVKVRPDNGLVVAGHTDATGSSDYDFAVMVLNEDGTLDTSFSGDGLQTIDASYGYSDYLAEVLLHDNGDMTLVGQSFSGPYFNLSAVQLDSSGTVDSGFNSGSTLSISGANDINPEAAIEDGEGNIYVVAHGSNNTNSDIILTRFNIEDGSTTDFASAETYAPLYYFDNTGNEYGYDLAFDSDGNILIAGTQDDDFAVFKFSIDWDNTNSRWDVTQDSSFNGSTGENVLDLSSSSTDFVYSMVSDKRGNYYIAGKQGTDTSIIRISADGSLDTTYGSSGIKTINLSSGVSNTPTILRTDALGQLLIFDTENAGSDAHVSITYDYILDPPAFGDCDYTSEFQSTSNKTQDQAVDASVASDNDYFIAGWSLGQDDGNKDFVVLKTDINGNFDAKWGENGQMRIDGGASTSITPYDVIGLSSTDVVIAGVVTGTDDLYLAKLDADGELDTSFDSDGIRDFSGSVALVPYEGIYVSSANAFLVAGKDSTNYYPWVYRFNEDGSDDLSFGAGSNVSTSDTGVNYTVFADANFSIYDMVVLSSGDIYLTGGYYDTYNKVALIKMDADGLIDTTFGNSGVLTLDQGSAHVGFSAATDGTSIYILAKDTSTLAASVLKVNSSGSLDTSFDSDGELQLSNYQISSTSTSSLQIDNNGAIWVQVSYTGSQESMLRLTSGGEFDTSFVNAGNTLFSHGVEDWASIAGFQINNSNEALLFGTVATDFSLASMSDIGEVKNREREILFDHGYGEHGIVVELDAYSSPVLAGYGRNLTDYDDDMSLAKFDNTGAGDNNFGSYGQSANAIELYSPNGESTQFHGFKIAANGNFYATADSAISGVGRNIHHARILPSTAAIDTINYGSGLTDLSGSNSDDLSSDQYLSDDGYLYTVGSTDGTAVIYRYDLSGTFNASFNASNGTIELSGYADSHLTAITATSDGALVAVGYYSNAGDIDGLIVKLNFDGDLDTSFSSDGIYEFQVASSEERLNDVAIGADGSIYAVGESNEDMLLIALDNSGNLNTQLNATGQLSYEVTTGAYDVATAINVDAFGAIFVLVNSNNEFALLRFKPDGTLLSDLGGTKGYSPISKMRDIAIDSLGNVFVTGSTQLEQQWQFFTLRFTNVVGPY